MEELTEISDEVDATKAVRYLLNDPLFAQLHGKIGGTSLYDPYISLVTRELQAAHDRGGFDNIFDYSLRINVATALMGHESRTAPRQAHPTDAESRMFWDRSQEGSDIGTIVVGGGPVNGGYSIVLNSTGENQVIHSSGN